jgi:disulfide bond formation protein DsbB
MQGYRQVAQDNVNGALPFGRIVDIRPPDNVKGMEQLPVDRARWPFVALLASALMLGAAHAIERLLLLAPCPLCFNQRQVYWVAGALALLTILLNWRGAPPRLMSAMCVLLGLVFLAGFGVASFHALVEWKVLPAPTTCAVAGALNPDVDLWERLSRPIAVPSCDKVMPPFPILGLSMAGWNALASIALAGLSFFAATRARRTDTDNETMALEPEASEA